MPFDELTYKHLNRLSETIRQVMKEKNLSNTGGAEASLEVKGNRLLGNDYIYFLDQGRKPGKFPPVTTMRDYVREKLLIEEKEVNQVAFLVGRKIKRDGTDIFRNSAKGLQLDRLVDNMLEELYKEIPETATVYAKKLLQI